LAYIVAAVIGVFALLVAFGLYRWYRWYCNWYIPPEDRAGEVAIELESIGEEQEGSAQHSEFEEFGYGNIDYKTDIWPVKNGSLGRGNFGYVYKAKLRRRSSHLPARYVAVKALTQGDSQELIKEATLMIRIPISRYIVRILGVCAHPPCMVMEFVKDVKDLDQYLPKVLEVGEPPRTETARDALGLDGPPYYWDYGGAAVRLLLDIAKGLDHLHFQNFVHRDVAARNMMVCHEEGRLPHAKVCDFGLARSLEHSEGTYAYRGEYERYLAAPENYGFKGQHSKKSDIFMLGIVFWEVFSRNFGEYRVYFEEGKGYGKFRNTQSSIVNEALQERIEELCFSAVSVKALIRLTKQCLQQEEEPRPKCSEICEGLSQLRADWRSQSGMQRLNSLKRPRNLEDGSLDPASESAREELPEIAVQLGTEEIPDGSQDMEQHLDAIEGNGSVYNSTNYTSTADVEFVKRM